MSYIVLEKNMFTEGLEPSFPVHTHEVENSLLLKPIGSIVDISEITQYIVNEKMRQLEIKREVSGEKLEALEKIMLTDVLWQLRNADLCQIAGVYIKHRSQ
jgi:hypothetical protein